MFGEIVDKEMYLNEYGKIVQRWWEKISVHFPNVNTGAFVIMPNHVHGIIFITSGRSGEVIASQNIPNQNNILIDENITKPQDAEPLPNT